MLVGFEAGMYAVVVAGIALSCIPLVVGNLLLRSCLKSMTGSNAAYRRHSGAQTVVIGVSFSIAAMLVPYLLREVGAPAVFAIDGLSYIVSIGSFLVIQFSDLPKFGSVVAESSRLSSILASREGRGFAWNWLVFCSLAALIPILASHDTALTKDIPLSIRQNLWAIEGITLSLSGFLYAWSRANDSRILRLLTFCSAGWLCLAFFADPWLKVGLIGAFGIASKYVGIKLSNDFILAAKNDERTGLAHASLGSVVNYATATISPLAIVKIVEMKALTGFVFAVLMAEIIRYFVISVRPSLAGKTGGRDCVSGICDPASAHAACRGRADYDVGGWL